MLSAVSRHSLVWPPAEPFFRPGPHDAAAVARSGGHGGPRRGAPEGLVLDGCEHGGRLSNASAGVLQPRVLGTEYVGLTSMVCAGVACDGCCAPSHPTHRRAGALSILAVCSRLALAHHCCSCSSRSESCSARKDRLASCSTISKRHVGTAEHRSFQLWGISSKRSAG